MALALSRREMETIWRAAALLPRDRQDAFIEAVLGVLESGCPVLGDGVIHRAIAATQRAFWDPPITTRTGHYHHG
jgi:hypothetical protein